MGSEHATSLGWIGVGRMGRALVSRLLEAGHEVGVYNRTREKALELEQLGAIVVDSPADLADRDIVFTMVAGSGDVAEVVSGPSGLLSRQDARPGLIVDSTTISPAAAELIRAEAQARGTAMLAAPVSGNPKVAESGRLTIVASGPADAWEQARPFLELLCRRVTYVGDGERARLVKVCHNLMLGVVAQCLAEITVLAEKGGVSRADFLEFLNDSVMGSTFTRYKSPAYVSLDFTPTFTPTLLLKDFHLGFEAARATDVSMPLAAAAEQIIQGLSGTMGNEVDFAALLELAARASGLDLQPEDVEVDDGLSPVASGHNGTGVGQAAAPSSSSPR
ncbi:MAG TPA: NAD(P)-dependent oxidoreductase [Solirubrobacteraceae bacterium]|jgi:3-hydroxyisobutyrate dehydrogenase-like beta-hydroxyacid dehydrogenase|nr:NAD(P)-dependent oxidoreductase [Solirubrobacteraceae bacterium]